LTAYAIFGIMNIYSKLTEEVKMPGFDGMGPKGRYRMGRNMGFCRRNRLMTESEGCQITEEERIKLLNLKLQDVEEERKYLIKEIEMLEKA
jgi:hypothetical protein